MHRKSNCKSPVALIVEDHEGGLAVRTQLLSQAGFEVIGARSFGAAVDSFRNRPVDIVITDIHLIAGDSADQSGLDLARFIRQQRPGLPIVGYSGHFDAHEIDLADREALDSMVLKGDLTTKALSKQISEWYRMALSNRERRTEPQKRRKSISDGFDVFLSHNSSDKRTVRRLARKLKATGLNVWFDEWELIPGRPWQKALEEIVAKTQSAVVLVGPDGVGPWEDYEMRACLSEFVRRDISVIPVLLPGAPQKPDLPLFLKQFTWVDMRKGLRKTGIDRLLWGITGKRTA